MGASLLAGGCWLCAGHARPAVCWRCGRYWGGSAVTCCPRAERDLARLLREEVLPVNGVINRAATCGVPEVERVAQAAQAQGAARGPVGDVLNDLGTAALKALRDGGWGEYALGRLLDALALMRSRPAPPADPEPASPAS